MQVQSLWSRRSTRGGHGNPLQYSCLENPIDGEALQAIVHWVTKIWTQLKRLSSHNVHLLMLLLMDIWVTSGLWLWICLYVSFGECSCSVAKSCPTLPDPMDCSTPGFPVHHQLLELAQTHVQVSDATNHLILCHPLLLLPTIFPSIRVSSNESVLRMRWPKYWSFSISPSNEYSGLIPFRIDWFDHAVQRTFKSLLQLHS